MNRDVLTLFAQMLSTCSFEDQLTVFLYLNHLKLESLCQAFTSVVLCCECWITLMWKGSERIHKAFGKWEICLTNISKKNVYAVCLKEYTLKVSMQAMVIWPPTYPQSLWFKLFPCNKSFRLAEGSHLCWQHTPLIITACHASREHVQVKILNSKINWCQRENGKEVRNCIRGINKVFTDRGDIYGNSKVPSSWHLFPSRKKYSTYANLFMESTRKIFAAYFHIFHICWTVSTYCGYGTWRG